MASIPVTIVGVLTYTGLEVGGGPMPGGPPLQIWGGGNMPVVSPPIYYPPTGGGGGGGGAPQPPLGIWGPTDPRPTPPIYMPPGGGGGSPPLGIWGGGNVPYPTPPIYFPPPEAPTEPPSGGDGKWGYVPGLGWVWVPAGTGDKPHPPQTPA